MPTDSAPDACWERTSRSASMSIMCDEPRRSSHASTRASRLGERSAMASKGISRFAFIAGLLLGVAGDASAQTAPKIGARDQLTITVFGVDGLSGKFAVGADGTITYPHLGPIRVAGLVTRELESDLTQKLKDGGYL